MLPAGRLRHRVWLQALTPTLDSDDGIEGEAWANVTDQLLPAEIRALSGQQVIAAQAANSAVRTRIRIRWREGVSAGMRVLHRETFYAVEAVIPDDNSGRRWLTLLCTSGTNEG